MTEFIQIIVLACKLSNGSGISYSEYTYKQEIKCQKSLIKCMDKEHIWTNRGLVKCLEARKP